MPAPIRFNLKQLNDLSDDFQKSRKSLSLIAQKVLREHLRQAARELKGGIPRRTGGLRKLFGYAAKRKRETARGFLGFFFRKRGSTKQSNIAALVLQKGRATPKTGRFLWLPIGDNRAADGSARLTPGDLLSADGFVRRSKAGNMIAFQRLSTGAVPMFLLKHEITPSAPPIPLESKLDEITPEVIEDIPNLVAQLIEAKRAAVSALNNG